MTPGAFGALGAGDPGTGGPRGLVSASSVFMSPVQLVPFLFEFLFPFEAELRFGQVGSGGPSAPRCAGGCAGRRGATPTAAVQ